MQRLLPLLLLVAVPAAVGQPDPRLRGVVLDPAGHLLPGARVTLRSPCGSCLFVPGHSFATTATDGAGRFSFPGPPRAMEICVEHPDFAPAWGVAEEGAVVRLKEPCFVTGTLSAPAEVAVVRGRRRLAGVRTAEAFRLGPLPPGETVTLIVRSPRHRPFQRRLVLTEGEQDVVVVLDEGLSLEGRVVPPDAGVVLRASQGEARESRAITREDGSFRLTGLHAGPVCVVVLADGREPQIVRARAAESLEVRLDR
ncbi:MAG: carboxypeptidase-like regulatory domain-containing protein [Planctomycetota bacterium]|jgi:hypothetical protein